MQAIKDNIGWLYSNADLKCKMFARPQILPF